MNWRDRYKAVAAANVNCGSKPLIGITSNYDNGGSRLAEAYYESIRQAGGVPVLLPPSVTTTEVNDWLLKLDGVVFSGGGDINPLLLGEEPERGLRATCLQRDLLELVLMRRSLDRQMPVLGICRGMQVMAAATGGRIVQDINTSSLYGAKALKHSQESARACATHTVRIEPDSILGELYESGVLAVNSFHHQAVASVGQGMKVTARSADGVVEAIESADYKSVLGVQWHPESFYLDARSEMRPIFEWIVGEAGEYKQARELHRRILTLDSHCDTPMFFDRDIDFSQRDDRILVDASKMRDGGLDASIMVAFLPQKERDEVSLQRAVEQADRLLDGIDTRIASVKGVSLAATPADLYRLKAEEKLGIMKGIENGYAIGHDIANIKKYRHRGVVYMTLCHNGDNDICDSAVRSQAEHGGLSDFGRRVVEEMNRLGMMVDLSHAATSSFYDAIAVSKTPVVCSHASCRALCDHPRNLDDDQLKALRDKGGVMQITLYSGFLRKDGEATIVDAINHLNHAVEVMGIDHVGLGTDFDGDGGVKGLADASELLNFTRRLLQCRYTEGDIEKLWGRNFLRVMTAVQSQGILPD